MKRKKGNYTTARSPAEIAKAIGLDSPVDVALMEFKARLSTLASQVIADSGCSVNEIVMRSGVARSKVSAIKNGALAGISSDLFLRVIVAAGGRVTFKLVG
jgi:predicted XRE-type DNA-binding protein